VWTGDVDAVGETAVGQQVPVIVQGEGGKVVWPALVDECLNLQRRRLALG
jgi:hypothetical protein